MDRGAELRPFRGIRRTRSNGRGRTIDEGERPGGSGGWFLRGFACALGADVCIELGWFVCLFVRWLLAVFLA